MSRRCIGYVGDGRARRPIYSDEGPASGRGRSSTPGGHAEVARIAHADASKLVEVGGRMPSGGASAIERRMATEAQRQTWQREADGPPARSSIEDIPTAVPWHAEPGSLNRMQASRLRGGERNRQLAAAARALEITVADPPVTPVTPEEPVMATEPSPPVPKPFDESAPAVDLTQVELITPCQRCAHAPVCAIRPGLQPGVIQLVSTPLDPALTIQAPNVVIDCSHFLDQASVVFNREAARQLVPKGDEADARAILDRTIGRLDEPHYHEAPEVVTQRPAAAGGGPGKVLTSNEQRVVDVVVRLKGDRKTAAIELGTSDQNVRMTLERIGRKGLLPADLIPLLPAGFAKYSGV